jgi:hypothetical protein
VREKKKKFYPQIQGVTSGEAVTPPEAEAEAEAWGRARRRPSPEAEAEAEA